MDNIRLHFILSNEIIDDTCEMLIVCFRSVHPFVVLGVLISRSIIFSLKPNPKAFGHVTLRNNHRKNVVIFFLASYTHQITAFGLTKLSGFIKASLFFVLPISRVNTKQFIAIILEESPRGTAPIVRTELSVI